MRFQYLLLSSGEGLVLPSPLDRTRCCQGDIVAILDDEGTAVVQYQYDAWGRPIGKTGSMAGTLGTVQPFRYRGYVYDEETGLYYLRSRYYSASMCRFVNADVLLEGNLYTYCKANPVICSDESGYAAVCCFDENGGVTSWTQFAMTGGVGGSSNCGMTASIYLTLPREKILPHASIVLRSLVAAASGNMFSKASGFLGNAFAQEARSYYGSKAIGLFLKATTAVIGSELDNATQNSFNNLFGVDGDRMSTCDLMAEVLNIGDDPEELLEEAKYVRNVSLHIVGFTPTYWELGKKAIKRVQKVLKRLIE